MNPPNLPSVTDGVVDGGVMDQVPDAEARHLVSETNDLAVLINADAVRKCASIEFAAGDAPEFKVLAIVLPAGAAIPAVDPLLKHCNLVAVTDDVAAMIGDSEALAACGELHVGGEDNSTLLKLRLFQPAPVDVEKLTFGAPRQTEKPADNLRGREDWYKKRHGGS